jgi:hypothetical protein
MEHSRLRRKAHRPGASPEKIAEALRKIDELGPRARRVQVKKPSAGSRRQVYCEVAQEYRTSPRTVERDYAELKHLCGVPAWEVPNFIVEAHRQWQKSQHFNDLIKKLVPELLPGPCPPAPGPRPKHAGLARRAKNERVALLNGGLTVLDNVGVLHADCLLTDAELRAARDFAETAEAHGIPFSTPLEIVQEPARPGYMRFPMPKYSSLGGRKLTTEQLASRLAEHQKEEAEDEEKRKAKRRGFETFGKASYREWREDSDGNFNFNPDREDYEEDDKRFYAKKKKKKRKKEKDEPEVFLQYGDVPKKRAASAAITLDAAVKGAYAVHVKDRTWLEQLVADYLARGGVIKRYPLGYAVTFRGKGYARMGFRRHPSEYISMTWRFIAVKDTRDYLSPKKRDREKLRSKEGDEAITFKDSPDAMTRLLRVRLELLRNWPGFPASSAPTAFTVRHRENPAAKVLRRYVCENAPFWRPEKEAKQIRDLLIYWRK